MMVVKLTLLLLFSFCAQPLFAQFDTKETKKDRFRSDYKSAMNYRQFGNCSQSLINAEKAYYGGRFNEVNGILTDCLAGFDKEQKTEAYRLLSLSYLFSKNFEKADSTLFLMLKTNPQYQSGPLDPPEFKEQGSKFTARPRFGFSLGGGAYQPLFNVTEVYNLRNIPSTVGYKSSTGYQLGISASYFISKQIVLEGGYEWQGFSFKVQNESYLVKSRMEESEKRRQATLLLGYTHKLGSVKIRLSGGVAYNTLTKAESSLYKLEKVVNSEGQYVDLEGEIVYRESLYFSNMERRTKHELRPILVLKVSVPQKNNYTLDFFMRYEYGTQNFTQNRYSDLPQLATLEWIEDDFKANYLTVGFGITKLYYHVKQKNIK